MNDVIFISLCRVKQPSNEDPVEIEFMPNAPKGPAGAGIMVGVKGFEQLYHALFLTPGKDRANWGDLDEENQVIIGFI